MSAFQFFRHSPAEPEPRGQVLVIVAAGLITMIAMTGLVVDGGYAWGQQRDNQNAADAASEAGAVVLAEALMGLVRTDADVLAAVNASVTANGVSKLGAWYTDIEGDPINSAGNQVGSWSAAADVGGGLLIPPNAAGVRANTAKTFDTFLVGVIGFDTLTANADATAVAGYLAGICAAGADCAALPVTIPLNQLTCDNTGKAVPSNPAQEWPYFNVSITIPLCQNNPGNVGWLDWTPPWGGLSEMVTAVGPPTTNPAMSVPSWAFMTSTGNVNPPGLEDALNYYAQNQIPILIPMFDSTCNTEPDPPSPGTSDVERCPLANVGGTGQQQWYHVNRFVAFLFDDPGVFLSGSNAAECEQNGNGATSCLKGQFVRFVTTGTVGPGVGAGGAGPNSAVGVQLIK
jgi:hypothetical protein